MVEEEFEPAHTASLSAPGPGRRQRARRRPRSWGCRWRPSTWRSRACSHASVRRRKGSSTDGCEAVRSELRAIGSCKVLRPSSVSLGGRGIVVWPSDEPRQACHDRGPVEPSGRRRAACAVAGPAHRGRAGSTSPPTSATVRRVAAASINWPLTISCWRGSSKAPPAAREVLVSPAQRRSAVRALRRSQASPVGQRETQTRKPRR